MNVKRLPLMGACILFLCTQSMAIAQLNSAIGKAYDLEARGRYKEAAALRLSVAQSPRGPGDRAAIDNLALAGADEFNSASPCVALRVWRRVLQVRSKTLYDADVLAMQGRYPLAFREYGKLFSGAVIPANGVFIDNGAVAELRRALQTAEHGRYGEASEQLERTIRKTLPFGWALLILGDLQDASNQPQKALNTWAATIRNEEPTLPGAPQVTGTGLIAVEMASSRVSGRCACR